MKVSLDSKVLRYVARHSPKHYANEIRYRCQATLKMLHQMWRCPDDYPNTVYLKLGCPHCSHCTNCLWVDAVRSLCPSTCGYYGETCTRIAFQGVTWQDVRMMIVLRPTRVELMPPNTYSKKTAKHDFAAAVKFLNGHIKWSNRKDWGVEYKKG